MLLLKQCDGDIDLWIICCSGSFQGMCKLDIILIDFRPNYIYSKHTLKGGIIFFLILYLTYLTLFTIMGLFLAVILDQLIFSNRIEISTRLAYRKMFHTVQRQCLCLL